MRFNFIIPHNDKYKLQDFENGSVETFAHLYCKGEYCWTLQTYYYLRDCINVGLSYLPEKNCINFSHVNILKKIQAVSKYFIVSLQADFPQYPLAHCHIVQNQDQVGRNAFYVPHWPQIGQRSRDEDREGVRTVAYQGALGFTDLDEEQLNKDLQPYGIRFCLLNESKWNDLSSVDVLVGIRSFNKKRYRRKPPSKLINAWHAEIPFIGGWDSAFEQIGTPGTDYLQVSNYDELIASIIKLRDEPELYAKVVKEGRIKAVNYTTDAITDKWLEILEAKLLPAYAKWENQNFKSLTYNAQYLKYILCDQTKSLFRKLYSIPLIKRVRDLYWDPVR